MVNEKTLAEKSINVQSHPVSDSDSDNEKYNTNGYIPAADSKLVTRSGNVITADGTVVVNTDDS